MPISADQWRAVVGSNSVRRPRQVISIEQLLLRYLSKTFSQQDGGGPQDATLSTTEDPTVDVTGPSAQTETLCTPKGYNGDTSLDDEAVTMVQQSVRQVLQWFVSLVTLSLLLLSGDVETNPGPTHGKETPEYRTIVTCSATIKNNLAQGAAGISDALFSMGKISDKTNYDIIHAANGRQQANILIEAIKSGTELNSDVFHKFIEALKKSGPWTEDMVGFIRREYEKEKRKGHASKPSAGRQRPDVNEIIDGIANRYGLTPDQLDVPCASGNLLREISKLIGSWKAYASYLGLSDLEEKHIQGNMSFTLAHERPEAMLKLWLKKSDGTPCSHYRHLLRSCIEVENNRLLAGQICNIIKNPPSDSVYQTTTVAQQESATAPQVNYEPEQPHHIFCELPPELKVTDGGRQGENVERDGAGAQCAIEKLWPTHRILKVFFMEPEVLTLLKLNTGNVMSWAEIWKLSLPSNVRNLLPTFVETEHQDDSDIRVKIVPSGGSWSKVGIDADSIDKSKATMQLGLVKGNKKYNRHLVIHEFGHALGLEHEHQRSKFWSVAKNFLDVNKMRRDERLKDTNLKRDYLENDPMENDPRTHPGSLEYDPESVMHYWFDKNWLTRGYHDENAIKRDRREGVLSDEDEKVLLGIHKRHLSLADTPSAMDHQFLVECYRTKYPDVLPPPAMTAAVGGGPATMDAAFGREPPTMIAAFDNQPASMMPAVGEGPATMAGAFDSRPPAVIGAFNNQPPAARVSAVSDVPPAAMIVGNMPPITMAGAIGGGSVGSFDGNNQSGRDEPDEYLLSDDLRFHPSFQSVDADHVKRPAPVQASPLRIGVIGSTNSGKSTTINALLRGEFLPSSSGGTTASVLCIKHVPELDKKPEPGNPSEDRGELYDLADDPGRKNPITGEENIRNYLDDLNEKCREDEDDLSEDGQKSPTAIRKLELQVPIPFLKDLDVELYDTPGLSEDEDSVIYKCSAHDQINGLILILSQDTIQNKEVKDMRKALQERFPRMTGDMGVVLVNKEDLFFPDKKNKVPQQKAKICACLKRNLDEVVFYSAKMGLQARLFHDKPQLAVEDRCAYETHKNDAKKMPGIEADMNAVPEVDIKQLSDNPDFRAPQENYIRRLSSIAEKGSHIDQVESKILAFLQRLM